MLTAASAMAFLPETLRKQETKIQSEKMDEGKLAAKLSAAPPTSKTTRMLTTTLYHWQTMLTKPGIQGISSVSFVTGVVQGSYAVTTIIYASKTLQMSVQVK